MDKKPMKPKKSKKKKPMMMSGDEGMMMRPGMQPGGPQGKKMKKGRKC